MATGVPYTYGDVALALERPDQLFTRDDVLTRPSPVPGVPGVYAWYFDQVPDSVPTMGCHALAQGVRLYVGISPGRPPQNGKPPSRQTIRQRIRYHYRGNASGSTLRLTLGCLLQGELGIQLRRVGSGERLSFVDGERLLSEWMGRHARVAWAPHPEPWEPEHALIQRWVLPLNLDQNGHSPFQLKLSELRAQARRIARELPVV